MSSPTTCPKHGVDLVDDGGRLFCVPAMGPGHRNLYVDLERDAAMPDVPKLEPAKRKPVAKAKASKKRPMSYQEQIDASSWTEEQPTSLPGPATGREPLPTSLPDQADLRRAFRVGVAAERMARELLERELDAFIASCEGR